MLPLERQTIFLTLAGSQAHGTAHDASDLDVRGLCVAPMATRLSLFHSFEQYEGPLPEGFMASVVPRITAHPTAARALGIKTECVIFDLAKFMRLCAEANPNALEILFADERDWLLTSPAWARLHGARYAFLTKKVQHTFYGYAMAQLKKIETHRAWLLNPPTERPSRKDFGLPPPGNALSRDDQNRIEQGVADKIRSYGIDTIELPKATRVALQERLGAFFRDVLASDGALEARMRAVAHHALQLPPDVVVTLNAEKQYLSALRHWESYQNWKLHRNSARAKLEREHGYDTKHAMHLIRLMRVGIEILDRGELHVRRDDAAELSAIRDGAMSFETLRASASVLQASIENAARISTLPDDIDEEAIDALLLTMLDSC